MESNSQDTWLSPTSAAGTTTTTTATATHLFQSDSPARPRRAPSSKTLLTMALLKAQSAVKMDEDGDVAGALEAYGRAVILLSRVMEASSSADEQNRLGAIHDSYLFRIRLLSTPPTQASPTSILSTGIIANSTTATDNKAPGPSLSEPGNLLRTYSPPSVAANEESGPSRTIRSRAASTSAADTTVMRTVTAESTSISTPASRRVTKHSTGTVTSALFAAEQPTRRPRAESIPTPGPSSTQNGQGTGHRHGRHHARTHTGGSTYRMTGDLVAAAEHLHAQAHHRLPLDVRKSRSKDLLSTPVPMHSAPTTPLPPTPNAHMQESTISSPTSPASTNEFGFASGPPPPSLASSQVFLTSLGNTGPASIPGKSSVPPTNYARRVDSLMPGARSTHHQHHQKEQEQTPMTTVTEHTASISSENSPEKEKTTTTDAGDFYEDVDMLPDEWLPNLSSKGFASAESLQDSQTHSDDPYPRERISLKGAFNHSQHSMETTESRTLFVSTSEDDTQKLGGATPAHHNYNHQHQHQRTFSQASLVHQPSQPVSSKRTPEVPQAAKAQGQQPTRIQSPPPQRPMMLRSQSSFSQLSAGSSSAEKLWSSNPHNTHIGHSSAMTLFEVISDDPFGGMSFPLPPPSIVPPPSDPFFRCFWLMRNLEQTMTSGGFVTRKLYVPRQIWYQRTLVRLPAAETKINVCQTLTGMLDRMATQSKKGLLNLLVEAGGGAAGDQGRALLLKELEAIEATALHVWAKLSKKLTFIHRPGKHPGTGPAAGGNLSISTQQQSQQGHGHAHQDENQASTSGGNGATSFDWLGNEDSPGASTSSGSPSASSASPVFSPDKPMGHKRGVSMVGTGTDLKSQWRNFSKTVQKSIGNDKVDDTSAYTEAIVRLFQSSYILESMLKHYNALAPFQTHLQIVNRLRRLCEFLNLVVCAFVVRDLGELMSKYTKRIGAWVAE
ncbi:hypothetical protein BG011_008497 [Mortierella polycephala]|uniref:MIT domain-containing protein n=1 Tax=Mortierella polycephala TaxID=41804 RepID=A0A9P6TX46_9FUNG|nr:hypothetical protein BG011_008497 [Mortierella polycephala]